jgi:hypothetical protein
MLNRMSELLPALRSLSKPAGHLSHGMRRVIPRYTCVTYADTMHAIRPTGLYPTVVTSLDHCLPQLPSRCVQTLQLALPTQAALVPAWPLDLRLVATASPIAASCQFLGLRNITTASPIADLCSRLRAWGRGGVRRGGRKQVLPGTQHLRHRRALQWVALQQREHGAAQAAERAPVLQQQCLPR